MTNTDNPYGVVHQVIQYDFGWTRETRITSASIVYGNVGDLLYWTDNVKPREINLTKANVVDKKKSWNLYFPVTCNLANTFTFTFKDFSGATIRTLIVGLSDPTNREQIIADITAYINGLNNVPVIAESCDCKLTFTEKVSGTVWDITSDCPQLLIPARLEGDGFWYGPALEERFFDRAKYQFLTPNTMTFAQDSDYEPNYVQRKVFQSRLQALYDDDSGTDLALGVWSQIGINNLGCDGTSNPLYNYIDVNFNGQDIADRKTLVVLNKIRLIMREHNDGSNRSIIDLEPCDFLDYDYVDNKWVVHYNFYNDIISSAVDPALAAKLFDNVPLKADSELFTKNRMVEGGILEGYDAPDCINAKAQMEFGDSPNAKLYNVTGRIKIFNYRMDNNQSIPAQYNQPNILEVRSGILYDTATKYNDVAYPFFGGSFESGSVFTISPDFAVNKKRQILPEGGWPVYAAGTDYFTISKQIPRNNVAQLANGALDVSTTINADLVKDLYKNYEAVYDSQYDLYSEFNLLLPDGEYIIRLGSHWCSFGDKLGKGFLYDLTNGNGFQQTSTYVWGCIPDGGTWTIYPEIKITVSGGDVYIGEFIVADLVFPNQSDITKVFPSHSGYVFDNFGKADAISLSQGVTVERCIARNTVWNYGNDYSTYQEKIADHNGFFFTFPDEDFNTGGYANRFEVLQVSGIIHNTSTQYYEDPTGKSALELLYSQQITTSYPTSPIPSHLEIILGTDTPDARYKSSTVVDGEVIDLNGNPISGVNAILQYGGRGVSSVSGRYSFIVWGDMINSPPYAALANKREGYLIFALPQMCLPVYPNGQSVFVSIIQFGANAGTTPPPYSPTAKYDVSDFIIDE